MACPVRLRGLGRGPAKSWGDDRQGNWLARNGLALILGLLVVLLMGALIYLLMQLPEFRQP